MFGAVFGDIIGSVYEGNAFFGKAAPPEGFDLIHEDARYTDDTVLTVATAQALLRGHTFKIAYVDWGLRYSDAGFGARFREWLRGYGRDEFPPYESLGNGSAMRVSPIPWYAMSAGQDDATLAASSAEVTHNHPEGIEGAVVVSTAIRIARMGWDPERIRQYLETIAPSYRLRRTAEEIRESGYEFDVTCRGSVPEAIICGLQATSFEEAVRLAISLNGDADTQAAIAGSIAEARFHDPQKGQTPLWEMPIALPLLRRLPWDMLDVLEEFKGVMCGVTPAPQSISS